MKDCPECGGVDTILTRKTGTYLYHSCDVDECSWEQNLLIMGASRKAARLVRPPQGDEEE